jgi:hypothetical protein
MVIAPARTGRESKRRMAVINTDQTKRGIRSIVIPLARILIVVVIKFTAPRIEETPAKWSEKMAKSTEPPA